MIDPFDEHCQRGCDYYEAGRFDQSIAEFRSALAIDPDCFDLRVNVASAAHAQAIKSKRRADWESASAAYRHAISLKPEDWDLLEYIVYIDWKLGRKALVLETLKAAIVADPDNEMAYDQLHSVQLHMGHLREATRTTEAMLDRFPGYHKRFLKKCQPHLLRAAAVSTVVIAAVLLFQVLKGRREEK